MGSLGSQVGGNPGLRTSHWSSRAPGSPAPPRTLPFRATGAWATGRWRNSAWGCCLDGMIHVVSFCMGYSTTCISILDISWINFVSFYGNTYIPRLEDKFWWQMRYENCKAKPEQKYDMTQLGSDMVYTCYCYNVYFYHSSIETMFADYSPRMSTCQCNRLAC